MQRNTVGQAYSANGDAMKNKGSPLVSCLPFHTVPFRQCICFFLLHFSLLLSLSPSVSLSASPSSTFHFFCRYPLHSVHAIPVVPLFLPFCRYPFESVESHVQLLANCIYSSTIIYPDLMKPSSRSRSGRLTRASRQQSLKQTNLLLFERAQANPSSSRISFFFKK